MSNTPITPNHMNVYWHDYTGHAKNTPVGQAGLAEKASLIGRAGLMLLSCGTGAWRVRSSMNTLAQELGIICNANIGLLSIDYTCFDGKQSISHSLSLSSTGVNTSKLNRMERFIKDFTKFGRQMTVGQLHSQLDEIDKIHGLYSPLMQGFASAIACCAFCFLLGGGPIEMLCTFLGAGIGNYLRARLLRRQFTLFLCVASSVALACLVYAGSMQYAGVSLLASGASVITTALMTVLINARHLFYALAMVVKYRGAKWEKPYLIFALTDETYSLVCDGEYPEGEDPYAYWFFISLFDQLYWVLGTLLGGIVAGSFAFDSSGIDFAMTALFVSTFTEQWLTNENHIPAMTGVVVTVLCRLLFGTDIFLIPSMIIITSVLLAVRRRCEHV